MSSRQRLSGPFWKGEDYYTQLRCIFVKCLSGKHLPSAGRWDGPEVPLQPSATLGLRCPGRQGRLPLLGWIPSAEASWSPWVGRGARGAGRGMLSVYMLILFCRSSYKIFKGHSVWERAVQAPFPGPCGFTGTGVRTMCTQAPLLSLSLFK